MLNLFMYRQKKRKLQVKKAISSKQAGITFIEVLVSFFILSTGILGAVAIQTSAQKGSFDAMQRSVASMYAQNIIERIRSNDSEPDILERYEGTYGVSSNLSIPATLCNSVASLCSAEEMVTNDLYEWEQLLQGADVTFGDVNAGGLVQSNGCIEHSNNSVTVVVSWESRVSTVDAANNNGELESGCGADSNNRRQVVLETFIY